MTLFAPTNEAIESLPEETKTALNEDTELLKNILLSHVVLGDPIYYKDLKEDQAVTTAGPNGELIRVNVYLKSKFYDVI